MDRLKILINNFIQNVTEFIPNEGRSLNLIVEYHKIYQFLMFATDNDKALFQSYCDDYMFCNLHMPSLNVDTLTLVQKLLMLIRLLAELQTSRISNIKQDKILFITQLMSNLSFQKSSYSVLLWHIHSILIDYINIFNNRTQNISLHPQALSCLTDIDYQWNDIHLTYFYQTTYLKNDIYEQLLGAPGGAYENYWGLRKFVAGYTNFLFESHFRKFDSCFSSNQDILDLKKDLASLPVLIALCQKIPVDYDRYQLLYLLLCDLEFVNTIIETIEDAFELLSCIHSLERQHALLSKLMMCPKIQYDLKPDHIPNQQIICELPCFDMNRIHNKSKDRFKDFCFFQPEKVMDKTQSYNSESMWLNRIPMA